MLSISKIAKRPHKMVHIEDEKNKEPNDLLSPELTSQKRLNEPILPDMPTVIREEVLFSIIYSSGNHRYRKFIKRDYIRHLPSRNREFQP